ncbi:MAG: J domain-containing protein [Planctomycetes bacterium]|nr:J domain-containing protein [Planctomycetota bacterium]
MPDKDFRKDIRRDQKARKAARQILGVGEDASREEIKAAWREKCKEYHPDRNSEDPDAKKRFVVLKCAYQFLTASEPCEEILLQAAGKSGNDSENKSNKNNEWAFFLWWRDKFF